jgi:hypothetical protein
MKTKYRAEGVITSKKRIFDLAGRFVVVKAKSLKKLDKKMKKIEKKAHVDWIETYKTIKV